MWFTHPCSVYSFRWCSSFYWCEQHNKKSILTHPFFPYGISGCRGGDHHDDRHHKCGFWMDEKMSPIVTFNLLPKWVKNFKRKSNTFDYMACNLKIVFDEFAVKRERVLLISRFLLLVIKTVPSWLEIEYTIWFEIKTRHYLQCRIIFMTNWKKISKAFFYFHSYMFVCVVLSMLAQPLNYAFFSEGVLHQAIKNLGESVLISLLFCPIWRDLLSKAIASSNTTEAWRTTTTEKSRQPIE